MSRLGWIDFSPDDRNKVSNVLSMLSEPGTLDELGIGQIRDAYADILFPGISTIQTRAKYFITIPRIVRDYQAFPSRKRQGLQSYLKAQENEVARVLASVHGENEIGIIGRTRINSGGVDRRPSVIYWNGLRTFGILKTPLSLADYCRYVEASASHAEMELAEIAEGSDDTDALHTHNTVCLPDKLNGWLSEDSLRLELSNKEAVFLKQKLIATPDLEDTVLTQLLRHDLAKKAIDIESTNANAFELLAELMLKNSNVSQKCKNNIRLANEFSLAIEGAHIRYNILAAKYNSFYEKVDLYEEQYQQWSEKMKALDFFRIDRAGRWLSIFSNGSSHSLKDRSEKFVIRFCEMQKSNSSLEQIDKLVEKQALDNKGERSLLKKKLNNDNDGWIGMRRLDYRWGSAKVILKDILEGLHA